MRGSLLETLARRPVLADGAMGTQLMARGLAVGVCGELWNVERAELVTAVHQAYREAGCEVLTCNTFGASRTALLRHGLAGQVEELNRAGVKCARMAARGDGAWVLGDVGPFGGFLAPMGEMKAEELAGVFAEQMAALKAEGVEGVIIETMVDPVELRLAVEAALAAGCGPVLATYAFQRTPDGKFRTIMGTTVAQAMEAAIAAGASVVGANCGTAITLMDYVRLGREMVAAAGQTPVLLQPNAGAPQMVGGRLIYGATPTDMAEIVRPLLDAGVRMIGGCCGTTPEHLKIMGRALRRK